jgi:hypothetical protein
MSASKRPADNAINGASRPTSASEPKLENLPGIHKPSPLSGPVSNGGNSSNGNGSSGGQSSAGNYVDHITSDHFANDAKNPGNNSVFASDGRLYQRKSVEDLFRRGGNKFPMVSTYFFHNGTLVDLSDVDAKALADAGNADIIKSADSRDLARANVLISVLKRLMQLPENKQHTQLPNANQEFERLQEMYRQSQPMLEALRQETAYRKRAKEKAEGAMQHLSKQYNEAAFQCKELEYALTNSQEDFKNEQRRANKLETRLAEESARCKQYQMESLAQQGECTQMRKEIAALRQQLALAESKASKPVDSIFVPPQQPSNKQNVDSPRYEDDFESDKDAIDAEAARIASRMGLPFVQGESKDLGKNAASNGNNGESDTRRRSRSRSSSDHPAVIPNSPASQHLSPPMSPTPNQYSPNGKAKFGRRASSGNNSPQPLSLSSSYGPVFNNRSPRSTPINDGVALSGRRSDAPAKK